MNTQQPVRVRFAPSPTGRTHLGSGRTALYNYLLARQTGGKFILRIEDTDQKRYVPGAEEELMDSLHWLGLEWDEGPDVGGSFGPYRQTERRDSYQKYAQQLIDSGSAYYCFCSQSEDVQEVKRSRKHRDECPYREMPAEDTRARIVAGDPYVIRFKMPAVGTVTAVDALRGPITVDNSTLDDTILVKSDGLPVYHLAVVVDDHLMEITHVFRTSEWLPTFPLHVHLYQALGWEQPIWIHPSIFLKPDGKGKMSKRDTAALQESGQSIFLGDMHELGYLPEAVVNWMVLMGWSYDDHTEFFAMPDLIEKFSIEKLNPSPAAINFSKLDHFNGLHIRNLNTDDLAQRLLPFFERAGINADLDTLRKIAPVLQVRLVTLDESVEKAAFFFQAEVHPAPEDLIAKKMSAAESALAAQRAYDLLANLPEITHETAEEPMRQLAEDMGIKVGQLYGIVRVAVTGQIVSPPLFESMEIIGREKSLIRIKNAIDILHGIA
ncbi:MAG TPA: glutamate--tRNA ligase [Chloroflexi bacterium]|nr:glutamate--tRNA ligase [Chloroflexota bacterium]